MKDAVIIVNFKTYKESIGDEAVRLAKECEAAAKEYGVDIRIAVQTVDIYRVSQEVSIPVYAQHADPVKPGQHTGWDTALAVKSAGAKGALLNHSEHRMSTEDIVAAARLLQHNGMDAVVCAESIERVEELAGHITPQFFCVEPPELIGKDVSVSHAQPDLIKRAVQASTAPLLVGAGVKTHEDLDIALELHSKGVLLASGIVLAKHRGQAFRKLLTEHGH